MVVAVDFDGTLCESKWPEIGREKSKVVRMVKEMQMHGDKIILWTCRSGELLEDAVIWCAERGLYFDAINENLPTLIEKYGSDSRKISADMYIDDKAISEMSAVARHEQVMSAVYASQHKCDYCDFDKVSICMSEACHFAEQQAREEYRKGRQ